MGFRLLCRPHFLKSKSRALAEAVSQASKLDYLTAIPVKLLHVLEVWVYRSRAIRLDNRKGCMILDHIRNRPCLRHIGVSFAAYLSTLLRDQCLSRSSRGSDKAPSFTPLSGGLGLGDYGLVAT